MLIDKRSTFARELSIPAAGGPTKFGEALPLSVAQDQGGVYPLYLMVGVPVAGVGGISLALELVTADNDPLTTNVRVIQPLGVFPVAALTLGAQLWGSPIPSANYSLFMGLRATVVGAFTAGRINAFFTLDPPNFRAYAEAAS